MNFKWWIVYGYSYTYTGTILPDGYPTFKPSGVYLRRARKVPCRNRLWKYAKFHNKLEQHPCTEMSNLQPLAHASSQYLRTESLEAGEAELLAEILWNRRLICCYTWMWRHKIQGHSHTPKKLLFYKRPLFIIWRNPSAGNHVNQTSVCCAVGTISRDDVVSNMVARTKHARGALTWWAL